jgi:hypothetical protein
MWYFDEAIGVNWNDETGAVVDADTGEPAGHITDYMEDEDEFAPEDDLGELSPVDVRALEQAIGENYQSALNDLRSGLMDLREDQAADEGYEAARYEDQLAAAAAAQEARDFQESLHQLSTRVGRPLSHTEAARIERLIPASYDDGDFVRAAEQLGIKSFREKQVGGGGQSARVSYMNERMAELEKAQTEIDAQSVASPDHGDARGRASHYADLFEQAGGMDGN